MKYVAVTAGCDSEDDAEAFGLFTSRETAEKFVNTYEEAEVRPAYHLMVVEVTPVNVGKLIIRETQE